MLRITGDTDDNKYQYHFAQGELILIEADGDNYSVQDAQKALLQPPLLKAAAIKQKISIQVGDGCILYLFWILESD